MTDPDAQLPPPADPWAENAETARYDLDPEEVVAAPTLDAGTLPEPPVAVQRERPSRRRRMVLLVLPVVIVLGGLGTWRLAPMVWPATPERHSTTTDSPQPASSCQDTAGWNDEQRTAWLKTVTPDIPASLAPVQFAVSTGKPLCQALTVSVDYWKITAHDKGASISQYYQRFAYDSAPLPNGHYTVTLTGTTAVQASQPAIPSQHGCVGYGVTVVVGGVPPAFNLSGYPANPMFGFRFPTQAPQAVQSPSPQGCP